MSKLSAIPREEDASFDTRETDNRNTQTYYRSVTLNVDFDVEGFDRKGDWDVLVNRPRRNVDFRPYGRDYDSDGERKCTAFVSTFRDLFDEPPAPEGAEVTSVSVREFDFADPPEGYHRITINVTWRFPSELPSETISEDAAIEAVRGELDGWDLASRIHDAAAGAESHLDDEAEWIVEAAWADALARNANEVADERARESVDYEDRLEEIRRLKSELQKDLEASHRNHFEAAVEEIRGGDVGDYIPDENDPDDVPERSREAAADEAEPSPDSVSVGSSGLLGRGTAGRETNHYGIERPSVDDE